MNDPIYSATDSECALATAWHGGQASMLYAVSSTGALSLGTVRTTWSPTVVNPSPEPFTDDEWRRYLVERLRSELAEVVTDARDQAERLRAEGDRDADDYAADRRTAFRWLNKLDVWLADHPA